MKAFYFNLVACILISFSSLAATQLDTLLTDTTSQEKLSHQEKKERNKIELKGNRFEIKLNGMYAWLNSTVGFKGPNDIVSIKLSMEDNFGLERTKGLFFGTFIYRATPKSSIYSEYYGLSRDHSRTTKREIIWKEDTIPAGTNSRMNFKSHVLSIGYMYSILDDPNSFLGIYFNAYIMNIDVLLEADITNGEKKEQYLAPLPDFGLVAFFKLNKWLYFSANAGMFYYSSAEFSGSLNNFSASLQVAPLDFIRISMGYQSFNVRASFPEEKFTYTSEYAYRGPSCGLIFNF